ncbi:hypothetical protein C5167_009128 [Papaver somniferum]|uniref:Uncharacterized protein n=1 Tax=Papaver somniferum TaxID=3469 RepID=A0A4Y7JZL7_PAPSO|nr:hypothetical protein C5167_009128 [Papaver somniferum]
MFNFWLFCLQSLIHSAQQSYHLYTTRCTQH